MIDLLVSRTVHTTIPSDGRERRRARSSVTDNAKQNNYNEIIDQAQSPRL